jgi:predicted transposase YdaD
MRPIAGEAIGLSGCACPIRGLVKLATRHGAVPDGTLAVMQEQHGPRPFDVTTRLLIDGDPESWLRYVGLPVNGLVRPIDSEVSTVLAEVDKVLHVEAPSPWLAHLELQSSRDRSLPVRLLQYHALLLRRHRLPVTSAVVLLRPQADGPELAGPYELFGPTGEPTITFRFGVIRVWERPVDELLRGGLGTLPLAPLAQVEASQLPDVIHQIDKRFERDAPPETVRDLWAATLILMGLRYDDAQIRQLLRGVTRMRESVTYQSILEEGREEGREEGLSQGLSQGRADEARRVLLRLGMRKFGAPDAAVVDAINAMANVEAIESLVDQILTATTWDALFPPQTAP